MKEIIVPLGKRSYPITIGKKTLNQLPARLKKYFPSKRLVIISNKTIAKLYQKKLNRLLASNYQIDWILIPDGERYKNLKTVEKIYHQLAKLRCDRQTGIIAFGGGVVGDISGFVAASYLRGIPYMQIPTTLLAQVDSSVGGKTGVDLPHGKNLVGAFNQPKWVLIDTEFLNSLPSREFLAGLAEVIKYGILWDARFFGFIEKNLKAVLKLKTTALNEIISRSVQIKAIIVKRDEKEASLRALLNLGHTLGHAIETINQYKNILHGEAISMGMVFASHLSYQQGYLTQKAVHRIQNLLTQAGLPTVWPTHPKKTYLKALLSDKKALKSKINFIAIQKIGKAFIVPLKPEKIVELI